MPRKARSIARRKVQAGKRYPLNMRTTDEIRRKLEEAANQSGRSLAQEVEHRVSGSFEGEKRFGEPELYALANSVIASFNFGGSQWAKISGVPDRPAKWMADAECYAHAVEAVLLTLIGGYPETDKSLPRHTWANQLVNKLAFAAQQPSETGERT